MTRAGTTDQEALRAISTFWNQNGCAPSLDDLADVLCIRRGSVRNLVFDLAAKGLVAQEPRISRTLRLTPAGIEALEGTFPLVPLTDEAQVDGLTVVRAMTPRHVECSRFLQAVTSC